MNKETPLEQQPISVLLHSRSVLEGEQCVATGVLSHLEGNLMNIELPEFEQFRLGEQVKVTMYSPAGMHHFITKIIARHQGTLFLVHPPHQQKKFNEKREYPRVEVRKHGFITAYGTTEGVVSVSSPIPIQIKDISIKGIGFTMSERTAERMMLDVGGVLQAELHLGQKLPCSLRIVRHREQEVDRFFGAAIEEMSVAAARSLHAFVLSKQVFTHIDSKSKQVRRG